MQIRSGSGAFLTIILAAVGLGFTAHAGDSGRLWTESPMRDAEPDAVLRVVDAVSPSVVSITNFKKSVSELNPSVTTQSVGTGFLVHSAGYIVTNAHVVAGGNRFVVSFPYPDGSHDEREATLVGMDTRLDLALLLAKGSNFPPALVLAADNTVRRGSRVIAIGNPFGMSDSVSVGYLAFKNRDMVVGDNQEGCELMQVDMGVNPGNSGGPLFNLRGEVVGVVSAVNTKGNSMGFAIPIDQVKLVLPQLHNRGEVTRSSIGVSLRELDGTMASGLGLRVGQALALETVVPEGAAARAGLRSGDLILKVAGQPVGTARSLRCSVTLRKPGTRVPFLVRRGETTFEVPVTLGQAPASATVMP